MGIKESRCVDEGDGAGGVNISLPGGAGTADLHNYLENSVLSHHINLNKMTAGSSHSPMDMDSLDSNLLHLSELDATDKQVVSLHPDNL